MNITTRTGLVGFFLALSALQISGATATTTQTEPITVSSQPIENRLTRLTAAIRQRESLLPPEARIPKHQLMALGWADGSSGGWGNAAWVNLGGGFVNTRPWANQNWNNGGGFWNYNI